MKKLVYLFSLCLFVNVLYAQNNCFDFKESTTLVTKSISNTKTLDFQMDFFINKLNKDDIYIPFRLPLSDEFF